MWTKGGNLFVAGGARLTSVPMKQPILWGNKLVYIWEPDNWTQTSPSDHGWFRQNKMLAQDRWYPSVTVLGDDEILVSGGSTKENPRVAPSTYEVARLTGAGSATIGSWDKWSGNQIYQGPTQADPGSDIYDVYPRIHLLASPWSASGPAGSFFYSGFYKDNAKMHHRPLMQKPDFNALVGSWTPAAVKRTLNSSVLFPMDLDPSVLRFDIVMRMGGEKGSNCFNEVEFCTASLHPDVAKTSCFSGGLIERG